MVAPNAAFSFSPDEVMPALKLFTQALHAIEPHAREAEHALSMSPMAADRVSQSAATGFTSNGASAANGLASYRDKLQAMVDALTTAAKQYGHTEDEITRTFNA